MTYDDLGKLFARVPQLEHEVQSLRERLASHTHDRLMAEDGRMPNAQFNDYPEETSKFG